MHVGCTTRVASQMQRGHFRACGLHRQGSKCVADNFCACVLHRQGSMCVAASYMCVVPPGLQVCCIPYKDIGISIVVISLVSYISHICGIF